MIYLDNCATTYPKPKAVQVAINEALVKYGANSGRSGFDMSMATAGKIFDCREKIAKMFNCDDVEKVIFTQNCTYALNMAIKGLLRYGDHVIISNLEHNAVVRPIETLAKRGFITYSIAEYDRDSDKFCKNVLNSITSKTTLIVCMHSSNVFGVSFPIEKIGQIAKDNNINFVVDAAQSAGIVKIDMEKCNISALCMPGHKGLYGPMGTGVMVIRSDSEMTTIIEGGTGSSSSEFVQPKFYPDRFESGTVNTVGIIGLSAGIDFVNSKGIDAIQKHEYSLINKSYDYLASNSNVKLYIDRPTLPQMMPVISFNFKDYSSEQTASLLNEKGIAVRAGYHCAYTAHKAFGTHDIGTVRISPSMFTSEREIDVFSKSLKSI